MAISGFNENNLSEESKKALQSETWQKAREAMIAKREIEHFTSENSGVKNAYGATWAEAVNTYLKTEYKDAAGQSEVEAFGITYKVLKRDKVTTFYDADGNTLFDVENERLASEYEWWMNAPEKKEETVQEETDHKDCQIRKQIEESGEKDLKCSANIDEKCKDCEKAATDKTAEVEKKTTEPKQKAGKMPEEKKKTYTSGAEKIKAEAETEYKTAKGKEADEMMKAQMEPIVQYISEKCDKEPEYNTLVIQNHKSWKQCYSFMMEKAKKMAAKGSTGLLVEGNTILKWIDEYYKKDDKVEVEAEKKRKEKRENAAAEAKEKAEVKAKEKANPTKQEKIKEEVKIPDPLKPKKNNKDMDGQMDLFSMLGM